jgi:hypothetical protein
VSTGDQTPYERTELEVRWNQRSFVWNLVLICALFLFSVTYFVLAPGNFRLLGAVATIGFGVAVVATGVSGVRRLRLGPATAVLDEFGVRFYQHDPVAWETLREVRFGRVKRRLEWPPLRYIAFVPKEPVDPQSLTPAERRTTRTYGTTLVLITQAVTPGGEEILSAVERFSDIPIRR